MELQQLISDPHAQIAATAAVLAGLSTAHKYLDAHPRAQAAAKLATGLLGPLNLPGLWAGIVVLARAIVAADEEAAAPLVGSSSRQYFNGRRVFGADAPVGPPPLPVPTFVPTAPEKLPFTSTTTATVNTTDVPAGAVKEWPKQ